ncbi:MAG: class I SAM-dependent methyltransferase [Spirochaetales bacterium]|nr:class I SAM-dependent methyltransferase [Spirochaetales bacterium]
MSDTRRAIAREMARKYIDAGDPLGWFEALYSLAGGDTSIIPWADLAPNPNVVEWLDRQGPAAPGSALKVGCGLGDDAEELARRGFQTTAFDISATAIERCKVRFPGSEVAYLVADLFSAPKTWGGRFDLVLESYTLQVLPPGLRAAAVESIAGFVAPGGTLLVVARGREPEDPEGKMPWPLIREELEPFEGRGLKRISFEDYMDHEDPPARRFRATYRKVH